MHYNNKSNSMNNNGKTEFSQFGTFSVIMAASIIAFLLAMLLIMGRNNAAPAAILIPVAIIMATMLLIFYKLTITVDDTWVSFRLGIGLVRKKYRISDIKSCKPVRNAAMYGIGIRKIPGGWLYNVSGLGAIELEFRNSSSIVRIGTDKPELVAQTINNLLVTDNYYDSGTSAPKSSAGYAFIIIMLFFAVAIPLFIILAGNREQAVVTSADAVNINGMYGLTIKMQDIISADTITHMPGIKRRTNGYAFADRLKGNFTLEDGSRVKLFIKQGIPPYLVIRTSDLTVYINSDNPAGTRRLFEEIRKSRVNP